MIDESTCVHCSKGNLAAVSSQRVKSREFLSLTILSETRLRPSSNDEGNEDNEEEDSNDRRKRHIVMAGLDGLLRIQSASNADILAGRLPYLHGMQMSEPISALAISSDAKRIAIGTTTGIVTVHQRHRSTSSSCGPMGGEAKEPRRCTFSYFSRGAHEKSHDPDDYLLIKPDNLLRAVEYATITNCCR